MPRTSDTTSAATGLIPARPTIPSLQSAAQGCRACELWQKGTQTVFGEGRSAADVMLVGEQPGDKEDIAGRPFVGPAGHLLDTALEEAGIDRRRAYVTNVVKHFNWVPKGKRRIHRKPNMSHITACRPWLEAEIDVVKPRALVCLGATAAQAIIGRHFKVSQQRGELVECDLAPIVTATVHPSSLLRVPPDVDRDAEIERFVSDLRRVAGYLSGDVGRNAP
ncbi:MAG: UdgX family uracil-DNA binding protein [Actinomycetota bacterium]|nr:UdgX family uracil-DNA binding protein [Actinomycetota bacterium]